MGVQHGALLCTLHGVPCAVCVVCCRRTDGLGLPQRAIATEHAAAPSPGADVGYVLTRLWCTVRAPLPHGRCTWPVCSYALLNPLRTTDDGWPAPYRIHATIASGARRTRCAVAQATWRMRRAARRFRGRSTALSSLWRRTCGRHALATGCGAAVATARIGLCPPTHRGQVLGRARGDAGRRARVRQSQVIAPVEYPTAPSSDQWAGRFAHPTFRTPSACSVSFSVGQLGVLRLRGNMSRAACIAPIAYRRYADLTRTTFKSPTRLECMVRPGHRTLN